MGRRELLGGKVVAILDNIGDFIKKQPWYVTAGVLVGAGVVGIFLIEQKKQQATQAAAAAAQAQANTPTQQQSVAAQNALSSALANQQDMTAQATAGGLNGYDLASMTGIPYAFESTMVPYTVTPPIQQQTTVNPPAQTSQTESGTVRSKQTSGRFSSYDTGHDPNQGGNNPIGVPMRNGPSPNTPYVTEVPYNAQVQITGQPVNGPLNMAGGSASWYPVSFNGQSGWVSADDIANVIVNAATGMGGGFIRHWGNQGFSNPDSLYDASSVHALDVLQTM